jgi:hypothetical protein
VQNAPNQPDPLPSAHRLEMGATAEKRETTLERVEKYGESVEKVRAVERSFRPVDGRMPARFTKSGLFGEWFMEKTA